MTVVSHSTLALLSVLSLVCCFISYYNKWDIEKPFLVSTIRCLIQLLLLGYFLKIIFSMNRIDLILLTITTMTVIATFANYNRLEYKAPRLLGYNFLSLLCSTWPIALLCLLLVDPDQITNAHTVIPFVGMIIGNALNGISLGMDGFAQEIMSNKRLVVTLLSYGATPKEASHIAFKKAIKNSTSPIINSMSVAGIVSVPGMMTGQIMAGMSPIESAKYQFVVMVAVSTSIFLGSYLGIYFCKNYYFKNGTSLEFLLASHHH
jgi:putative ABC transport system permease protein